MPPCADLRAPHRRYANCPSPFLLVWLLTAPLVLLSASFILSCGAACRPHTCSHDGARELSDGGRRELAPCAMVAAAFGGGDSAVIATFIPLISPSIPAMLPQPITSGSLFSRGECSRPRNRSEPAPVRSCLYLRSTWSKMASKASVAEELLRREPRCHTHDVQVRQNALVGCRTNDTGLLLSTMW